MVLSEHVPRAVQRLREIGGVLDFAFFHDADDADATLREAMAAVLRREADREGRTRDPRKLPYRADLARIRNLRPGVLTREQFFGDWCDGRTSLLIRRGTWITADGRRLENPTYQRLAGTKVLRGGSSTPGEFAGGQFAYAFSQPPYGLRADPGRVQALFTAVTALIVPRGLEARILDWTCPELPEVSEYFEAGAEWWGVFLFTVFVPATRSLTVISASATD